MKKKGNTLIIYSVIRIYKNGMKRNINILYEKPTLPFEKYSLKNKNKNMNTISVKVIKETIVDEQLPFPFYRRRKDGHEFIALLDENTVVGIYKTNGLTIVKNSELSDHSKKNLLEAWDSKEWTACTETEFLDKYDAVIESIFPSP